MPEFQRKSVKFKHSGMQWNRPIDSIPEEQICIAKNCRVNQQGAITQRPGHTLFATLTGAYTHSIARMNNYNTNLIAYTLLYLIGQDNSLYVGATGADLANAAINPVKLAGNTVTNSLSGNPLTMVDMAPVGTNVAWKYIGDNSQNFSVGKYPADATAAMARSVSMGMTPPVTPLTVPAVGAAGLLTGAYQWVFAYRNRYTGARSNPSAPTRVTLAAPSLTLAAQKATIVCPTTPLDPQTAASDVNVLIDIYRFGGTIFDWRYVGTASSGATFTDNVADSEILTSATPPQVTDPVTGVTRFNLFRPFVVQDNAVYSAAGQNGLITIDGTTGIYTLTADIVPATNPTFNINWLPGQVISINNNAWTIYQVISSTQIEIAENPGANLVSGSTYPWATLNGTLTAGAPLPHIWGPYGLGETGAVIFGCGSTNRAGTATTTALADAGTLYWTNGNDPDSTDLTNSLLITSPSEPLCGGCIYDGTPFVWSTERMFRIYPSSVAGQFTVQEVPGGKGLWAEYSLTVQSNTAADQSVSWVGKDGIYDWSTVGGLQSLTDRDMYPYFPHDNQVGIPFNTLFPGFPSALLGTVNAPSFSSTNMKYHRLTWFQGELFYDYPTIDGGNVYFTLVFDTKTVNGWMSLDEFSTGTIPMARGIEIAANNMKVGRGPLIHDYTGITDNSTAINCTMFTRQDDCSDPRAEKLFGDFMVDITPGLAPGVNVFPLVDYGANSTGTSVSYGALTTRAQFTQDLTATGLGYLSRTFGFYAVWDGTANAASLYGYTFSFVPKPEKTTLRATDKTDDGFTGAKYLRGLCIESNTYGLARAVKVLVDDVVVATLSVNAADQLELPFAITPIVGSEFQLQPADTSPWELFQVRWTWEKWPDLTVIESNWMDLGTTKPKYVRGLTIPISGSNALPISFTVTYDGGVTVLFGAGVTPVGLATKTAAQYSFLPPILAHQLKMVPTTPCRVWYDEIKWDAEEWPERAILNGPWQNLGTSGAKYLRGFELPIETGTGATVMELHYDQQPTPTTGQTATETFAPVTTTALSKNVFPFTPAVPIIAHEFQLKSNNLARFWESEVKWDFEPWPELDTGRSAWIDAGDPGAKFMQGLVMPIDTNGQPVTFDLVYDGGVEIIGPLTTTAGRKTPVPWSYPVPFIAHEFQLAPRTNCRIWEEEIKWIWEPVPELVTTYTTQETDHDLPGWQYFFDAYIAYIGTAAAPVFSIVSQYGTDVYTLPVSNGVYTRAYLLLNPRKAKWHSYSITCSTGVRLFLKDCEVRVKNWTDKGQYPSSFQSMHPFGEVSRIAGARI